MFDGPLFVCALDGGPVGADAAGCVTGCVRRITVTLATAAAVTTWWALSVSHRLESHNVNPYIARRPSARPCWM